MLPPFGKLAMVGLAVDAPFIALAMIGGSLRIALSLLAGWALVVGVYGLLHLIVGRGLDMFAPSRAKSDAGASNMLSVAGFAGAMLGKYILIGAFLFLIWRTGYLAVLPFLAGFVLAQIGITWLTVREMKKPIA